MDDLLFRLQTQIEALEADARALQAAGDSAGGSQTAIGVPFTQTTYPTAAARVFAVRLATPGGTETEGSTGTVTVNNDSLVYALNLGSAIPTSGTTPLVLWTVGSRWVFRHD